MILVTSLILAALTPPIAPGSDGSSIARAFLEVFASKPAAAAGFATRDAMISAGDIGGPFDEFIKEVRLKATWMDSCKVTELEEKPAPTADELKDSPPWMKGGRISVFEGAYNCTRPDGSNGNIKVSLVLKDDKVAMLGLWSQ